MFQICAENAYAQLDGDPTFKAKILGDFKQLASKSFSMPLFCDRFVHFHINLKNMKVTLQKGLESYLASTTFSKTYITGIFSSGPTGKCRAQIALDLLDAIDIERLDCYPKMITLFYIIMNSNSNVLKKNLYVAISSLCPHQTFIGGLRKIFGEGVSRVYSTMMAVGGVAYGECDSIKKQYDYLVRQSFSPDILEEIRSENELLFFSESLCSMLVSLMVKKGYEDCLAQYPSLDAELQNYTKLFNRSVKIEDVRRFLETPPRKSYLQLLPKEIRMTYVSNELTIQHQSLRKRK